MSKLSIKGVFETLDKLSKCNPLRYMTNGSKNKTTFSPTLTLWSGFLVVVYKIHHCNNFYWVVFIRLTQFAAFWLISCIIVLKKSVLILNKETGKS